MKTCCSSARAPSGAARGRRRGFQQAHAQLPAQRRDESGYREASPAQSLKHQQFEQLDRPCTAARVPALVRCVGMPRPSAALHPHSCSCRRCERRQRGHLSRRLTFASNAWVSSGSRARTLPSLTRAASSASSPLSTVDRRLSTANRTGSGQSDDAPRCSAASAVQAVHSPARPYGLQGRIGCLTSRRPPAAARPARAHALAASDPGVHETLHGARRPHDRVQRLGAARLARSQRVRAPSATQGRAPPRLSAHRTPPPSSLGPRAAVPSAHGTISVRPRTAADRVPAMPRL